MRIALLSILFVTLAGCAGQHHRHIANAPPFYVPFTATTARQTNPYDVLPASDAEVIVLRTEKTAYGGYQFGQTSAYTAFTSDSQSVGIRHSGGTGYRYRWIVETGITAH